ncbi:MAG TPA: phosphatase PAP2 family protein [Verrucomicrobiae bacterium]|nr:phosphatase PAP2 family protein [Verrucomicrobiae bacterium]
MNPELLIRILADYTLIIIALLGAFALLFRVPNRQRLQAYSRIVMAGLTALLIAKLVAAIWQPSEVRPFIEKGVEAGAAYLNNPGFPSDHALFAAAIVLAVYFETPMKKLALVLGGLTLLMALGRVLALVHTPLDIVGGLLFAAVGALWYASDPTRGSKSAR